MTTLEAGDSGFAPERDPRDHLRRGGNVTPTDGALAVKRTAGRSRGLRGTLHAGLRGCFALCGMLPRHVLALSHGVYFWCLGLAGGEWRGVFLVLGRRACGPFTATGS